MSKTRHIPEEEINKLHGLLGEEPLDDELFRRIGEALRKSGMGFSEELTDENLWEIQDKGDGQMAYESGRERFRTAVCSAFQELGPLTEVIFRVLQRDSTSRKLVECAPQEFAVLFAREVLARGMAGILSECRSE